MATIGSMGTAFHRPATSYLKLDLIFQLMLVFMRKLNSLNIEAAGRHLFGRNEIGPHGDFMSGKAVTTSGTSEEKTPHR